MKQHSYSSYQSVCQTFVLTLISLIFVSAKLTLADTYYISSATGSDQYTAAQAKSSKTPWKTIEKLNTVMTTITAGDTVLFKRGESFYGSLENIRSGNLNRPIYFGAYGQGKNPVLSGLTSLTNWKSIGNGVYEINVPQFSGVVLINGKLRAMGRFPNAGYLSYENNDGNNSITDNELGQATNWTGAEVVIRKNRWTIDRSKVTSQSGGKVTYAAGTTAVPTKGYGYFFQNSVLALDEFGEWSFDAGNNSLMVFFGNSNPNSFTVAASTKSTLINLGGSSYVTFENLDLVGAGINAFKLSNTRGITIKNCTMEFIGQEAVMAASSPDLLITNSLVNHTLSGGINIDVNCTSASILNNVIKNIALFPGQGRSGSGTYEAITAFGNNTKIEKNRIDSIGYNGVYFGGNSSITKNNYISNFCLVKDDGAGIYVGDWSKTANKKIIGNVVVNGIGNTSGTNSSVKAAEGIYIDDLSSSVIVNDNTVTQCSNNGIKLHNASLISVSKNTVYNNGNQLRLEQDHYLQNSTYLRDNRITGNIFFSKEAKQASAKMSSHQDDIVTFGELDSNFYCRPIDEMASINAMFYRNGNFLNQNFDLSEWKAAFTKDVASKPSPTSIPAYKVDKVIGSNLFANGTFNSDIKGLYGYSTINDIKVEHNTGKLDGGALKISVNSGSNNHIVVNMQVGKLTANKKYLLKYSVQASSAGLFMQNYLRKTGAPYAAISSRKDFKLLTSRTENEYVFMPTTDENDGSIIFEVAAPSGVIYLDNVTLTEVTVKEVLLDDYLLFDYNASAVTKTVFLNKAFVDVNNVAYNGKVEIKPYSSIILLAKDAPVSIARATQTITFANAPTTTYANKPVTVAAVASSGLPVSLKVVSGPGTISGNTLSFLNYGTTIIEASQDGSDGFEPAKAQLEIANVATTSVIAAAVQPTGKIFAYPNPFKESLTVEVTSSVSGDGKLLLYDMNGKVVSQIYSGALKGGEMRTFQVNSASAGLTRGMYIVRFVTASQVLYQKLINIG